MSELIPCVDCGVEFSPEILRAHLSQRHTIWSCEVCGKVIRHLVSEIEVERVGTFEILRIRACSRTCLNLIGALDKCVRCGKPLIEDFADAICPPCANRPIDLSEDEEEEGPLPDPPPDRRAAWLPPPYRRGGWRLDRSPADDEEEAA